MGGDQPCLLAEGGWGHRDNLSAGGGERASTRRSPPSFPPSPRTARLLRHPLVLHRQAAALQCGDHGAGTGVHASDGYSAAGDCLRPHWLLHRQVYPVGEWGWARHHTLCLPTSPSGGLSGGGPGRVAGTALVPLTLNPSAVLAVFYMQGCLPAERPFVCVHLPLQQ